jgi:hypothetical protein
MIRVIAFDIEASALTDGFPVSIGVASSDGRLFHALIRPHESWVEPEYRWNPVAERIHGYSLEKLQAQGLPPAEVVAQLNEQFSGEMFASDAPPLDTYWMRELNYAAGGIAKFDIRRIGIDAVLTMMQDEVAMPIAARNEIERLRKRMHTHNALEDAASWIAALEAVDAWASEAKDLRAAEAVFKKWRDHVKGYLT